MHNWINIADLIEIRRKSIELGYASGKKPEADPLRDGFKGFVYKDGEWEARDSYTGYFRSWGEESVRFKNLPVWVCLYGGGMTDKYLGDSELAHRTFEFLKFVLITQTAMDKFNPRGPNGLRDGDWFYENEFIGDITKFRGSEAIKNKNEIVFTHDFIGGLVGAR